MSKDQLRFDGKVAVVTGAGGGLGRAYALFFASRGAKVVVNDLGTSTDGQGKSSSAADKVVEEIKKAGGEAVSNYNSVEDGDLIVKTAIDKWGRIDILINNAGILRDTTFIKMTEKDWDLIYKVHLYGVYKTTKAAWSYMRDQKYGRIIMTTSAAGLYGNFGQANYSSMKLAQVGMASTLAIEGAKTNVFTNTIAPVAGSRMTATVMPPELVDALKPEYVVPLVAFLCHEGSDVNGGIFEVGAGWVSRVRWQRTPGNFYDASSLSPEKIKEGWEKVIDWNGSTNPTSLNESLQIMVAQLQKQQKQASEAPQKKKGNENVDVDKVLAHKFEPSTVEITDKDVMLYALAIGEATDPMDDSQLKYVYENHSNFSVLPTMGVLFPFSVLGQLISTPGLTFNPMMLLHAEQYLELKRPIPTSGKLTTTAKVGNIYDKGKAALLTIDANTVDEQNQLICVNQISVYIRGIGGFGGDRGPSTEGQNVPPKKAPDAIRSEKTNANQALIYRLCGDRNPLHADPAMAAVGGFDRPILHGLCFFGYAGRAVLKAFADNDPSKFKSIRARFSKSVFPGETLVTEMWKVSDNQVVFQCKVAERPDAGLVLSNGLVELHGSAVQRSNTSASSNIKANL